MFFDVKIIATMEQEQVLSEQLISSIIGDLQLPFCNDSNVSKHKLDTTTDLEREASRKSKKKRRSSLSNHRRSITGFISTKVNLETEPSSQGSSENEGSQQSQSSESDKRLPGSSVDSPLDITISKLEADIAKFENECKEWDKLFSDYKQKESETKTMCSDLTLSMENVPANLKELGTSEYIKCQPLDLLQTKQTLDKLFLDFEFNRSSCIKDVRLIKETAECLHSSFKHMSGKLSEGSKNWIDDFPESMK
ncbi:uncharacterized protein LOC131943538 isoform X2 [Physella acuta]|uniref:uncharacterized protein LOC131943538 isoform X2 n=1 Tax=Physella acuta TaxID=109671 RepID=UPI0027DB39B1|nr:uncharacterized protein LOC131943538 isoform X2 [Physella acuta]